MTRQLTRGELLTAGLLVLVGAALVVPWILAARRTGNERNSAAALSAIARAEADFRSNDRDGNLVNDFWTADVYGLHGLVTPENPQGLRLISSEIALADAASNIGAYHALPPSLGAPFHGYIFRRFEAQDYVGDGKGTSLHNDTDGSGRRLRDRTRFAFMACPVSLYKGAVLYMADAETWNWVYRLPNSYSAAYDPTTNGRDSSSTIVGTGHASLDNGSVFPRSPSAIGCAKYD